MSTLNRLWRFCAFLSLAYSLIGGARVVIAEQPLQLLFYGNSHTVPQATNAPRIPDIISNIAVAAGHSAPIARNLAVDGQSLQWHLDNNTAGISTPPPPGNWDFVIMQDRAAGPTHIEGSLSEHISSSLDLYEKVAMHSPNVVPVMYETWARGAGSEFYTAPNNYFANPSEMQAEVRDAYHMSTDNINASVGMDLARFAPVGDAWEEANFYIGLYRPSPLDYNHASNLGKLLTSLVLYSTIYEDKILTDIDLTSVRTSLGLSTSQAQLVLNAAQTTVAVPEPSGIYVILLVSAGLTLLGFKRRLALNRHRA